MNQPLIKAFVLCTEITDTPGSTGQKDLRGSGLHVIRALGSFPFNYPCWVYLEISDNKPRGKIQLAPVRADSGRRLYFRSLEVEFPNRLLSNIVTLRGYQCVFPAPGVYFVELWYNEEWQLDQRLEVR